MDIYFYERDDALEDISPSSYPRCDMMPNNIITDNTIGGALNKILQEDEELLIGMDISKPMIEKQEPWMSYEEFDFNNKNLSACNLSRIEFKSLDGAILFGTRLKNIILPNIIKKVTFDQSTFENVDFKNKIFYNCSFVDCIYIQCQGIPIIGD